MNPPAYPPGDADCVHPERMSWRSAPADEIAKPPIIVQMALAHTGRGRYVRVGTVTHHLPDGYHSINYEIAMIRNELWRLGLKWQDVTEWRLPLSGLLPRNRRKTTTAYRRELARQVGAEEREMPQFVEAL